MTVSKLRSKTDADPAVEALDQPERRDAEKGHEGADEQRQEDQLRQDGAGRAAEKPVDIRTCAHPHRRAVLDLGVWRVLHRKGRRRTQHPEPRMIDPTSFDPAAVSDEIRAQNAEILARLSALPDTWSVPPAVVRRAPPSGASALSPPCP